MGEGEGRDGGDLLGCSPGTSPERDSYYGAWARRGRAGSSGLWPRLGRGQQQGAGTHPRRGLGSAVGFPGPRAKGGGSYGLILGRPPLLGYASTLASGPQHPPLLSDRSQRQA